MENIFLEGAHKIRPFIDTLPGYKFKKSDSILQPGDKVPYVYFIERGHVRVSSVSEAGEQKISVLYKKDELFPLNSLSSYGVEIEVSHYYDAQDSCLLRKVYVRELMEYLRENQDVAYYLNTVISHMYESYVDRIENLTYTHAYPRFIARLLHLVKRFGEKQGKNIIIQVPLTHKDIAHSIAMTRETASRQFSRVETLKLVSRRSQHIIVHDIQRLREELRRE